MPSFTLALNGKKTTVDAHPGMPLLRVLRDTLGLTGTEFGCEKGLRGSCTVRIDGEGPGRASRRLKACEMPGLHEDNVVVHTTLLGGGYERRTETDTLEQAIEISKAVGAERRIKLHRVVCGLDCGP